MAAIKMYGFYGRQDGKWVLSEMRDTGGKGFDRWDMTEVMAGSKLEIIKECTRRNVAIAKERKAARDNCGGAK